MKKYDRIFAFGCSFTNYHWATWADIIAYSYPEARYYNMGLSGAGNELIYNRVMEADARYNFTKNDLVIVQWSGVMRESRWVNNETKPNGGWTHGGNVMLDRVYFDDKFVEKYVTMEGFHLRDLALVKAVNVLLDLKQPEHYNIAMVGIKYEQNFGDYASPELVKQLKPNYNMIDILMQKYQKTVKEIRPSFYDHILEPKRAIEPWHRPHVCTQREGIVNYDWHPTPYEHFTYLRDILPEVALAPDCDEVAQAEDKYVYDRFTVPADKIVKLRPGRFNLGKCTDMNFVKEYYNVQVKFGSFNPSKLGLLTFNRPEVIY